MDIEVLKRAIVEYQEFIAKVDFVRRDFTFEGDVRYVLVGIRQAGKSYLMYQRARDLMSHGYSAEDICYVNFDD